MWQVTATLAVVETGGEIAATGGVTDSFVFPAPHRSASPQVVTAYGGESDPGRDRRRIAPQVSSSAVLPRTVSNSPIRCAACDAARRPRTTRSHRCPTHDTLCVTHRRGL